MIRFQLNSALAALVVIGSTLAPHDAAAHGIWFAQRATQIGLIYGVGADDLDMVKRLPQVRSVAGYDDRGTRVPTTLRAAGPIVLVDCESPPRVVTAVLYNGIWSRQQNNEWVKKGRDEVPDAKVSEKNFKYAVSIVGALSSPLPTFADQTLQIIPAETIPLEMGKPLRLRVLFEGKPVANARVLSDFVNDPDAKPLVTDAGGNVTVAVRNQGLNVVAAIFDGPSDEPTKADKMEHLATLAFTLPHAPE